MAKKHDSSEMHEVVEDSNDNEVVDGRSYSPMVLRNVKQILIHATRQDDKDVLREALQHYEGVTAKSSTDTDLIKRARQKLFILETRTSLVDAVRKKNEELVRKILKELRPTKKEDNDKNENHIPESLGYEITQAKTFLKSIKWANKRKAKNDSEKLVLTRNALVDLRSCHKPPQYVHQLLQATLLLFGEDEDSTEDWRYCRSMISLASPYRKKLLNGFDFERCEPELVKRSKEIIDLLPIDDVMKSSTSAACIHNFTRAIIEEFERKHPLDDVTPANIDRQREILKRPLSARSQRDRRMHKPEKEHESVLVEPIIPWI